MADDLLRLTIADAAERLNVSADTIRRRLKRGRLRGQRDNRGQWWVDVQADAQAAPPRPPASAPMQPDQGELVTALRNHINDLTANLERARHELEADRADHRAVLGHLHGDLDQAHADRRDLQQRVDRLQGELLAAVERAATAHADGARAQGALEALQARLAEMEASKGRSWLRRILGQPGSPRG